MSEKIHEIDICVLNTENNQLTITKLDKSTAQGAVGLFGIGAVTMGVATLFGLFKISKFAIKRAIKSKK